MSKLPASLHSRRFALLLITNLLFAVSLACAIPGLSSEPPATPTATQERAQASPVASPLPPTPTPQSLPPDIIESDPAPGSEVPLDGPIRLYFNQAMDRDSVEAALSGLAGDFEWENNATLVFTPTRPFEPETEVSLTLEESARAANGLPLSEPVRLAFQTVGFLRLAQRLPEPGASEVDPSSAVVAAFNRPVVPLGIDSDSLPSGFTLEPDAGGRGEWLNTSTYIFYPEPALAGGMRYSVRINPALTGTDGSPLEEEEAWSFTTAVPELVSIEPETGATDVRLDTEIVLTFNQPMDADSVAESFQLLEDGEQPVPGDFTWNDGLTVLTFTPDQLLKRSTGYTAVLDSSATGSGGTPLASELRAGLETVPALEVLGSEPSRQGVRNPYASVVLHFNAPVKARDVLQFVTFSPDVPNLDFYLDNGDRTLRLFGNFAPETDYTLVVSPNMPDAWSGRLGQEFTLEFRTLPLDPALTVSLGPDVLFLTPQDSALNAQVTNLSSLSMTLGDLPMDDFTAMLAPGGYDLRAEYEPESSVDLVHDLDIPANTNTVVELPLTREGAPLEPGLYFLRFNLNSERFTAGPYILVVNNVHLALKLSATDVLVWAIDLRDGAPVADAPVAIYSESGERLVSGETDSEGVFRAGLPRQEDPYTTRYAVLGEPGEEHFAVALSNWNQGLEQFDIPADYSSPGLKTYLYTDRPIYRPGQTVFFRAIARQAYNGRYTLPDQASLSLDLVNDMGERITNFDPPLSAFGTAHGSYRLPEDLAPGHYRLQSEEGFWSSVSFQVAEYRKPEIDLQVAFEAADALAGESLQGSVNARYFFDAPAGNVPVNWNLYRRPDYFQLSGYEVGIQDERWMSPFAGVFFDFGEQVATGQGEAGPDGTLHLEFPSELEDTRQVYTLEVTAVDESGLPVSARAEIVVNPAEFYIGLRPDAWVGQAGRQIGFEVQVVDWEGEPAGERSLRAEFQKVVWEQQDPDPNSPYDFPTFEPVYTPVGSADFVTAPDGVARLAFTPPEAGTYQLSVTGLDPGEERARSEVLLWVGGPGQAVWPNLPNQRLRLTADREIYQPGDTAQVFIPNPLGDGAQALVTIERGVVLRHQVLQLDGAGQNLSLPLDEEDAPNVYVSVTLLKAFDGGAPDFRHGYLNLPVEPVAQTLHVELTSDPERTGPGQEVTFGVRVTDAAGEPVEGEFSLAVVDQAVLALADPNSERIIPAFYGNQPLGVRTGLALAAYTRRNTIPPGGLGGGGGELLPTLVVREDFLDTAFWNAQIVTDENGEAQVVVDLPDNLTTWQVDLRGLTADTLVGEAESEVIVTKDLLVRPVTPRFLVLGDHALLAAVVQNNTAEALEVQVSLQASGFALDEPDSATQRASLPAGGRERLEWWGTVEDVESVDLVFSAAGGGFEDAARPALGALPVLRYTAPQTFGTAGLMDGPGERLELVSLPRSFVPNGGGLHVELAPSLGSAMVSALEALEHFPYECTEQTVSRFLPNLEAYRVLQDFGLEAPALQSRLDRTLQAGLSRLLARQNEDGGWGWWQAGRSDAYISAYVLFGLIEARQAGVQVDEQAILRAVNYLNGAQPQIDRLEESWEFDRAAFETFVLAQAGSGDLARAGELYEARPRLNPWAQALLAETLATLSPGDERISTLLSDLESTALRTATGAHWEDDQASWQNMSTPIYASAVVLYTLAKHDPASPLVADAVRYLMAHRSASGGWNSTYETAWTLLALTRVMQGTGELSGNFDFSATMNGTPLASGEAGGEAQLSPVTAELPVAALHPGDPNALLIERDRGTGRLYYTAHLQVNRPVEAVRPLERGLSLSRAYYQADETCLEGECRPVREAGAGELLTVRLSLAVPETAYYLLLEDYIPAGAEVLDTSLKTSQGGAVPSIDPQRPFAEGWGWWYFSDPQVYDDRIAWAADSLPPGTYELTYTLVLTHPGEYRVLPARAWQFYFPEVQANSAGEIFEIVD